jgi:dTDP-4-dehydrorhamnose 3,5-epimerase-like enzyme
MKIIPTEIADALIIEPRAFGDHRSFYRQNRMALQFTRQQFCQNHAALDERA